ncbi:hypothetical protein G7046_g4749 [Stylonectria norvegica]|nr:hypothetical protein G7046_g4749 [Stylonectria norvegica]
MTPESHRPETPKPEAPAPAEPETSEGDGITDYHLHREEHKEDITRKGILETTGDEPRFKKAMVSKVASLVLYGIECFSRIHVII